MSNASQATRAQSSVREEVARNDFAHWKAVSSRATNPVTARLIVEVLNADPAAKAANIGVYLAAYETVKRAQIRYAQAKRMGIAVGAIGRMLFRAVRSTVGFIASGGKKHDKAPALKEAAQECAPSNATAAAPVSAKQPVREADELVFPTIMYSLSEVELKGAAVH